MASHPLSTIQWLRQGVQQRFEANFLELLQGSLAARAFSNYEDWLFGSRALGDWDGRSDTDLQVVADAQDPADAVADTLPDAGCGADVIAFLEQLDGADAGG